MIGIGLVFGVERLRVCVVVMRGSLRRGMIVVNWGLFGVLFVFLGGGGGGRVEGTFLRFKSLGHAHLRFVKCPCVQQQVVVVEEEEEEEEEYSQTRGSEMLEGGTFFWGGAVSVRSEFSVFEENYTEVGSSW